MAGFLTTRGSLILANGYNIIPIRPGKKFPDIEDWQHVKTTEAILTGWKSNGWADYGIGITTGEVAFADVDIGDADAAKEYQNRVVLRIGFAPTRIGNWPKHGYLFLAEKPFKKLTSREFCDPSGKPCRVEILGEGQQFVCRAIHPDTGKPYKWIGGESPDNTPKSELPVMTERSRQTFIDIFEELMAERGWPLWRDRKTGLPAPLATAPADEEEDNEDPFLDTADVEPIGLSIDELRAKVELIPNDDADYEGKGPEGDGLSWFNVMAAIHHETDGSEDGKEVALEWSERSPKHELEPGRFEKTWRSFSTGDQHRPVTSRLLLKLWKKYRKPALQEKVTDIISRMDFAKTTAELEEIAADAQKLQLGRMERNRLVNALRKIYKALTNSTLGLGDAREMVRYRSDGIPDWLENWVYLHQLDKFFNTTTKDLLFAAAFDRTFSRNFVSDSTTPSQFALARVKIPILRNPVYMPNEDLTFTYNGDEVVNLYTDRLVPEIPTKLTGGDRKAVEIVEQHLRNICPTEREFQILVSWMRYLSVNRERPNWAVVIQGPGGDGKQFISKLMAAVLGPNNTYTLNASTMESTFNAWSHGHLYVAVEEIYINGQKYAVLNRIKPLIGNEVTEVHPKGRDPFNVPNTQAYMFFTNYRDALPVDDNDRRYFIVMARWGDAEELAAFMLDKPTYFGDLDKAISRHAGALRGWLDGFRPSPEFAAKGRAPYSEGREEMAALNRSEEAEILAELLETETRLDITRRLLLVSALTEELYGEISGRANGGRIRKLLIEAGFKYIGRIQINGTQESVWTKTPKSWPKIKVNRHKLIEKWLKDEL